MKDERQKIVYFPPTSKKLNCNLFGNPELIIIIRIWFFVLRNRGKFFLTARKCKNKLVKR